MSYAFDLLRLPPGLDRKAAYRALLAQWENASPDDAADDPGPIVPDKEQAKAALADALIACYPSLKPFQRNFAQLAQQLSLDESEARRLYRNIELNDQAGTLQIILFDETAGLSFSPNGPPAQCREQLARVWDCLHIFETQAGLSAVDPQLGRVLDLAADFPDVLHQTCPPIDAP